MKRTASRRGRNDHSSRKLRVERLEDRATPTADLVNLEDVASRAGQDLLVPLELVTDPGTAVTYTAESDNPLVGVSIVPAGPVWELDIEGVTGPNADQFSGTVKIQLFENEAPLAVEQITTLTNQNFYDGRLFSRVIDGFVAQAGSPTDNEQGGSNLPDFEDEFDEGLTFTSPGMLALANSGDDVNNSQFFITDIDEAPLDQPNFLNFNHTILGIVIDGQEIMDAVQETAVSAGTDDPLNPPQITDARIVADGDEERGILRITPAAGFTGTANITVGANDGDDSPSTATFEFEAVTDNDNDRPFLLDVPETLTTSPGTGVSIDLDGVDLDGDALSYRVGSGGGSLLDVPPNATDISVDIDEVTGRVTLTPTPGFVGDITLGFSVRDSSPQQSDGATDPDDSEVMVLSVVGDIDLDAASDGGVLDDDNVTDDPTPSLTVRTAPGQDVTVAVNGGASAPATEGDAGVYTVTLPAGTLRAGENEITAQANDSGTVTDLAPLTITYAPSLEELYVVPGEVGSDVSLAFDFINEEAQFESEFGVFVVDDLDGSVGGLTPGQPGYAAAALAASRRTTIFSPAQTDGATTTADFEGGDILGYYLIQDGTADEFLADNPDNNDAGSVLAFFSLLSPNPDSFRHLVTSDDPLRGVVTLGWEDAIDGGDQDFNDVGILMRPASLEAGEAFNIAVAAGRFATGTFTLRPATEAGSDAPSNTADGEVGLFFTENAQGLIAGLLPGDAGYAEAAVRAGQSIFTDGDTVPTSVTRSLTGGQFVGFYYIPGSNAAEFLTDNPNNDAGGNTLAYFSFDAANPDGAEHFRTFGAELVTREEPSLGGPTRLHLMGDLNGTDADFDDLVFDFQVN